MDLQCSYEDCGGSPKHCCTCDKNQKSCEIHIDKDFQQLRYHPVNGVIPTAKTSTLLALEMKQLSSTMSKVMLAGKDMFQEICRKLCEITSELSERQDKLIEMASNLSSNENLPEESFKKLGDLGLNFRSSDEFGKLVDDHFSIDTSRVEFSFFSKDIASIMEHLKESNSLLKNVSTQGESEALRRKVIEEKISNLETRTNIVESGLIQAINKTDLHIREREARFADKEAVRQLEDKITLLEGLVNHHKYSFEEVNTNYANINSRLISQYDLNQERERSLIHFTNKTQNQLNLNFSQLREIVEQRIVEINQVIEINIKIMEEEHKNKNDELKDNYDAKIVDLDIRFERFCDNILTQIDSLAQNYKNFVNNQNFQNNVRKEIDEYNNFKAEEALRITGQIRDENKAKSDAEEFSRIQQENNQKKNEEELRLKHQVDETNKIESERIKKREEERNIMEENERSNKEK